jgi:hypothetical protein
MRLLLRAGTVCGLLTSAVMLAAPAAFAAGLDDPAKARAAGIAVDPGAERLMQEAPTGSCFNDPTQATCPRASRVAAATPGVAQGDGSIGFALVAPAPGPALANAAAAGVPQCFVKSDRPFFAAGLAQGNGAQTCTAAVTRQELYVTLYDYVSTGRRQLDTRASSGGGGTTLRGSPKFDCYHPVNARQYQTLAEGYALLQGVWYAASQTDYETFTCPNPGPAPPLRCSPRPIRSPAGGSPSAGSTMGSSCSTT